MVSSVPMVGYTQTVVSHAMESMMRSMVGAVVGSVHWVVSSIASLAVAVSLFVVEVRVNVSIPESLRRMVAHMVAVVGWLVSVISVVSAKPVHVHRGGAVGGVDLGEASVNLFSTSRVEISGEIIFFQIELAATFK